MSKCKKWHRLFSNKIKNKPTRKILTIPPKKQNPNNPHISLLSKKKNQPSPKKNQTSKFSRPSWAWSRMERRIPSRSRCPFWRHPTYLQRLHPRHGEGRTWEIFARVFGRQKDDVMMSSFKECGGFVTIVVYWVGGYARFERFGEILKF